MPPRAPSVPPAYPRADPRAADGVAWTIRLGATDRLCETLSSWRLLVGGVSPAASHHSFITSSEGPPLSNFNNYRDIPVVCVLRVKKRFRDLLLAFSPSGAGGAEAISTRGSPRP